jgi:hypothetical protein
MEFLISLVLRGAFKTRRVDSKDKSGLETRQKAFLPDNIALGASAGDQVTTAKQQDAKIQKVSDQIEMSRPAPQMVLNNP